MVTSACSFHSLAYLGAGGEASASGGETSASGGNTGGSGGNTGGSGGQPAIAGATSSAGVSAAGAAGMTDGAAGAESDPARCDDLQKNGDETDVDCGGRACAPCPAGDTCAMGTDCQSAICTNVVCQPPNCTDLALNGDETDLNCGGTCSACAQGKHCSTGDDCSTGNCTSGLCESGTCADGVLRAGCPLLVDSTPYSLSPAGALANCIDNEYDSVSDGNALKLHSCQSELRQTFWAVQRADGYFAFRNALSGKCLHVRGTSTSGGAVIEQSTCSFAYDQLWKPSLVNSSVMSLISRFSGLSLNVAGDKVGQDGQAIVQGQMDASADTNWRVTRRSSAAYVAFAPDGMQGVRLEHDAQVVTLGAEDQTNAQWIVVPGLSDASLVSFQSRNDPGRFLRHASFRLWSDTNDGTDIFKRDATFRYAQPFVGTGSLAKSIESANFPGRYWTRDGSQVSLASSASDADYKQRATWRLGGR